MTEKKKYEIPEMEVILFDSKDIITTSSLELPEVPFNYYPDNNTD